MRWLGIILILAGCGAPHGNDPKHGDEGRRGDTVEPQTLDENSAIRGTGADFTLENQRCRSCDYGPAGYNIPHRLVTSILYSLPFGKGQTIQRRKKPSEASLLRGAWLALKISLAYGSKSNES